MLRWEHREMSDETSLMFVVSNRVTQMGAGSGSSNGICGVWTMEPSGRTGSVGSLRADPRGEMRSAGRGR